ncbi:molybdopterin-dependent oxidoreductase [Breoghania sp.]|uniref:molybdopterin-dependent oxidoreductase n=1 Tax=Breoghania sp. TaxID=2065378 RepID=UPI00260D09B1|nr:molybdopterin-dependent oxidoreductase [Breoghania sp.]MDJ0932308.1 molybdopterin-dependent oxidoreductase [Breoghania sp.]
MYHDEHPSGSWQITRRGLLSGVASIAALSMMGTRSFAKIVSAVTGDAVLSSADSDGLIDIHVTGGKVTKVTSLDPENNLASLMGLNWYGRDTATDRILYPMVCEDWKSGGTGGDRSTRGEPRYRRVSWDEAFELVAAELKRVKKDYGNEAFLAYVVGGW